jgi:hypothetical protein
VISTYRLLPRGILAGPAALCNANAPLIVLSLLLSACLLRVLRAARCAGAYVREEQPPVRRVCNRCRCAHAQPPLADLFLPPSSNQLVPTITLAESCLSPPCGVTTASKQIGLLEHQYLVAQTASTPA